MAVQFMEFRGRFYKDSFTHMDCRENKLDTGEYRMIQKMRSQEIARVTLRQSTAIP